MKLAPDFAISVQITNVDFVVWIRFLDFILETSMPKREITENRNLYDAQKIACC